MAPWLFKSSKKVEVGKFVINPQSMKRMHLLAEKWKLKFSPSGQFNKKLFMPKFTCISQS
jgi:hypothetical protein